MVKRSVEFNSISMNQYRKVAHGHHQESRYALDRPSIPACHTSSTQGCPSISGEEVNVCLLVPCQVLLKKLACNPINRSDCSCYQIPAAADELQCDGSTT